MKSLHSYLSTWKLVRLAWAPLFGMFIFMIMSCSPSETSGPEKSIDSLFREYYSFKKRINPIEATKAGYAEYNGQVANYISKPYQQDLVTNYKKFLEELAAYDSTRLTDAQWMSLQVMQWDCQLKLEGLTNPLVTIASPMYDMPNFELMPLLQIQSLHLYFSQLAGGTSLQPFRSVNDYETWLQRVDAFLPFLDTAVSKMQLGMRRGVVLPKVLIERMIPQLDEFVKAPVKEHLFYMPILLMSDSIPTDERARLAGAYEDMVVNKIVPKYKMLQDFLLNTYLPACRETSGINSLPNGRETFQYLIKYFTTTNMTAQQIHAMGLNEVARIRGEMDAVKTQIGFKGNLRPFFDMVRTKPDLIPFRSPEEVIANFNRIRERVERGMPKLFEAMPKGGFEVRRTETFREASASAEFLPGNKDGSRPGVFYVPIRDVSQYNKFADESLFLHEAIPGHYYQLTLQQENTELPEFLHPESISVFVEGWALYAESLGKELGMYEDPYQDFGMLSMEMHRAIRLVLETGIHDQGWTREQAIQYSLENEAESLEKITVEVERYMATPGAALCYKVGQLKIRELRTAAEAALGDQFDIREFHNQVLNSGSLPLLLLEKKINMWMRKKKADK